jgi:hypothetical protein
VETIACSSPLHPLHSTGASLLHLCSLSLSLARARSLSLSLSLPRSLYIYNICICVYVCMYVCMYMNIHMYILHLCLSVHLCMRSPRVGRCLRERGAASSSSYDMHASLVRLLLRLCFVLFPEREARRRVCRMFSLFILGVNVSCLGFGHTILHYIIVYYVCTLYYIILYVWACPHDARVVFIKVLMI